MSWSCTLLYTVQLLSLVHLPEFSQRGLSITSAIECRLKRLAHHKLSAHHPDGRNSINLVVGSNTRHPASAEERTGWARALDGSDGLIAIDRGLNFGSTVFGVRPAVPHRTQSERIWPLLHQVRMHGVRCMILTSTIHDSVLVHSARCTNCPNKYGK
ncbi:hypothetical protein GGX14DRAFT_626349 [Mycena pura]|uniref:Secreted protein n=1 Tax=Mycena pura TaxID=153505 RepID=A0AAD6VDP3_9AGAR|nr:hypothetical protein GGX14DRAFT_626349 [Mycena pura]